MLSNEHLIKLFKKEIKKTYHIYLSTYDWKGDGLIESFKLIIYDIKTNIRQRKWCRNKIRLLKKTINRS